VLPTGSTSVRIASSKGKQNTSKVAPDCVSTDEESGESDGEVVCSSKKSKKKKIKSSTKVAKKHADCVSTDEESGAESDGEVVCSSKKSKKKKIKSSKKVEKKKRKHKQDEADEVASELKEKHKSKKKKKKKHKSKDDLGAWGSMKVKTKKKTGGSPEVVLDPDRFMGTVVTGDYWRRRNGVTGEKKKKKTKGSCVGVCELCEVCEPIYKRCFYKLCCCLKENLACDPFMERDAYTDQNSPCLVYRGEFWFVAFFLVVALVVMVRVISDYA